MLSYHVDYNLDHVSYSFQIGYFDHCIKPISSQFFLKKSAQLQQVLVFDCFFYRLINVFDSYTLKSLFYYA